MNQDICQLVSEIQVEGSCLKDTLLTDNVTLWFHFKDEDRYTSWKHKSIRIIRRYFPDDYGITELENAFKKFEREYRTPELFSQIIGLIESYLWRSEEHTSELQSLL